MAEIKTICNIDFNVEEKQIIEAFDTLVHNIRENTPYCDHVACDDCPFQVQCSCSNDPIGELTKKLNDAMNK